MKERLVAKLVSQAWASGIFWKMNPVSLSLQKKQLTVSSANDNIGTFKEKPEVRKTCIHLLSLTASQYLKTLLMRWVVMITKVVFFVFVLFCLLLYNETRWHMENLNN